MVKRIDYENMVPADPLDGTSLASEDRIQADLRKQRILQIVKAHPDGISTSEISEALRVTPATARSALREIEREREIYSKSFGKKEIQVWFPNGRIVHPFLELFREFRGKTYRYTVQEGRSGPIVQIQERTFSLVHGDRVEGAIFFDYVSVDDFMSALQEMKNRYESIGIKVVK